MEDFCALLAAPYRSVHGEQALCHGVQPSMGRLTPSEPSRSNSVRQPYQPVWCFGLDSHCTTSLLAW